MAQYFVAMDNEVFGPYSLDGLRELGILPDTLICTNSADSSWKVASLYSELQPFFEETTSFSQSNNTNSPDEGVDEDSFDDSLNISPRLDYDTILKYQQKRKAALIGVLTLGLAGLSIIGVGETWRSNIFQGTSMDHGGLGFVLKLVSFCFLSVLIAIPVFIISLIQLIYYSIKLSSLK